MRVPHMNKGEERSRRCPFDPALEPPSECALQLRGVDRPVGLRLVSGNGGVVIVQVEAARETISCIQERRTHERRRLVAACLQYLGERHGGGGDLSRRNDDAVQLGRERGERGDVRRQGPGGRCDDGLESRTFAAQLIETRRSGACVAITPQVIPPQRVDGDQEDVWRARGRCHRHGCWDLRVPCPHVLHAGRGSQCSQDADRCEVKPPQGASRRWVGGGGPVPAGIAIRAVRFLRARVLPSDQIVPAIPPVTMPIAHAASRNPAGGSPLAPSSTG